MAKNKAQQRARAKRQQEKMQRRQQERARRIRTLVTVAVVAIVGVTMFVLFGGKDHKAAGQNPLAKGSQSAQPTPNKCASTTKPCFPAYPVNFKIDPKATYTAEITTNYGAMTLALDAANAPKTVRSFVFLAENHFFDGLTFHRVIPNFMIQGGDPKGDGTGGPGYQFADEHQVAGFGGVGVLAMANSGPNTNGSQFFITVHPTTYLNGKYNIFGHVLKGQNVADAISKVKTDQSNNKPVKPVIIQSVKIQISGGAKK